MECQPIDPPIVSVNASVNDSPLAGKDGAERGGTLFDGGEGRSMEVRRVRNGRETADGASEKKKHDGSPPWGVEVLSLRIQLGSWGLEGRRLGVRRVHGLDASGGSKP